MRRDSKLPEGEQRYAEQSCRRRKLEIPKTGESPFASTKLRSIMELVEVVTDLRALASFMEVEFAQIQARRLFPATPLEPRSAVCRAGREWRTRPRSLRPVTAACVKRFPFQVGSDRRYNISTTEGEKGGLSDAKRPFLQLPGRGVRI
jgi:hypothetical protein